MQKKATLLLLIFLSLQSFSQEKKVPDLFKNMSMRSIGPATMSGRVTSIDVADNNENLIYIGAASGGVWKSESGGVSWEPVFDKQDLMGIGSVCIDPSASDIVWVGTGEGNPRNSQTSGAGIFRSPDGGKTWKKMGLEKTLTIHRIIVHPTNSDIVYAGVHGSAWGPNTDRGVFRTTNGGSSWEKVLYVNDSVGCSDLVMDPGNPNKMFAAMYQYQRKPYYFTSGGKGSGLHVTTDGGKTWQRLDEKNGLPEGNMGRIGMAISRSNPKIVYALIECSKTGLYKSTDGGFNWKFVTDKTVTDRPFYYHEIYVDPSNENHLIYLHSIVSESIDGGNTWTTMLPYSGVHPDHHALWWSTANPKLMMEGNDGGFNISRDGGYTWTFINNLPLGQFYHVNYDMEIPYNVYGGLQDNGSWKGPGYAWHFGGINAADWQEVMFGDGFDVVPQPDNSRYLYAMSQGGELNYVDTETGYDIYIQPFHPDGLKLRFHWNAGISADPFNNNGVYFGSQFLHHSIDNGKNWEIISPDLTTNDPEKLKQNTTGGITPDQTNAENHCTILCIAPSTLDKNVIWVGTDDGNIQLTTDGGKSWHNCSPTIPGLPKNGWVPQIVSSTYQAGEAFVVVNNYRQNDWSPYLFHTTDFGKTWKNLVSDKSVSGHCLSVVQDPKESQLLFLGTENGLYVSFDTGSNWMKWTHDYPSVATQDLKIHPRENDLIIGTFGRALYILDDITPLRNYARQGEKYYDKKLVALSTPNSYQAARHQPHGERFAADLQFEGDNKPTGARLGYYFEIKKEEKKDEKKTEKKEEKKEEKKGDKKGNTSAEKSDKKKDEVKPEESKTDSTSTKTKKPKDKKVTVTLLNLTGDTLRVFKHEPDTGFNYINWHYDTKGVRYPARNDPKDDQDQPGGGPSVGPGMYKVVYSFNEFKDSTTFQVLSDPRLKWNEAEYNKSKEMVLRINKSVERAASGMDALRAAKKTITLVSSAFINVPDSTKKNIISQGDSLNKKIEDLTLLYFQKEDAKGYLDNSDKLTSKMYDAYGRINSKANGTNAEYAVRFFESETNKVVEQINSFFENDWKKWQADVEKLQFSLFKEVKKI